MDEPAQPESPEREPDYRMSLAAERTYLSYLRTGLAMVAAGVGVVAVIPDAGAPDLRRAIGLVLTGLGAVIFGAARPRWQAVIRAMRRGQPLPPPTPIQHVGLVLAVSALVAVVVVILA